MKLNPVKFWYLFWWDNLCFSHIMHMIMVVFLSRSHCFACILLKTLSSYLFDLNYNYCGVSLTSSSEYFRKDWFFAVFIPCPQIFLVHCIEIDLWALSLFSFRISIAGWLVLRHAHFFRYTSMDTFLILQMPSVVITTLQNWNRLSPEIGNILFTKPTWYQSSSFSLSIQRKAVLYNFYHLTSSLLHFLFWL